MKYEVETSIERFRINRQYSIEQVAHHVGCSGQTIRNIERGIKMPGIGLSLKLSDFFDIPVHELFTLKK